MIDWSQMEHGALTNFLAAPGALRSAFEKFITECAQNHKTQCALFMQSAPRDPERAADHAAKAQAFDEFWAMLTDELTSFERPLQEPTLQGLEGVSDEHR